MQRVLYFVHTVLAIVGTVLTASAEPRERVGFVLVTILFGTVALTVWLRSRWVIVPGGLLMVLAAVFTFFAVVGNIAWPESEVLRVGLSGLGLLLLEAWTVLYVCLAGPTKMPTR